MEALGPFAITAAGCGAVMIIPVLIIGSLTRPRFYLGAKLAAYRSAPPPSVASHAWLGLVPQAGLSLAFVVVIQNTFPSFGAEAGVLLLSVLGVNQIIAPVLLRRALIRTGEAGKKAGVEFAADGH